MGIIYGRTKEKQILEDRFNSNQPELIVVYGRRRIGKTWLIREFFQDKDCIFFKTTGTIKERTIAPQIYNFLNDIKNTFGLEDNELLSEITTWEKAFELLTNKIKKHPSDKKLVLFFDEIPWMDTPRSRFLSSFGHFWNHYVDSSLHSHIKVIVCGSSTSWMIRNMIKEKGALHQRKKVEIPLKPFDLSETKDYLSKRGIDLSNKTILETYFAIGGVAEYLNRIQKGKTSVETIEDLFFLEDSSMRREFESLYSATFQNHKIHLVICEVLAGSMGGMTRAEIIAKSKKRISSNKETTQALEELTEASFLKKTNPFSPNKTAKGTHDVLYKLVDEYSLFYYKWIHNKNLSFDDGSLKGYWSNLINSNSYNSWAGHAFESVCHKNIVKIKEKLSILSPVSIHWWKTLAGEGYKGAEIDLLIQRVGRDESVNICELKFYNAPVELTNSQAENIKNKKESFKIKNKFKSEIFITLITLEGAVKNKYYTELIDNQISLEDFF